MVSPRWSIRRQGVQAAPPYPVFTCSIPPAQVAMNSGAKPSLLRLVSASVTLPRVATLDQGVSLVRTVDTPGSMRYHHWRVYGDEEMAGAPAGGWLAKAKGDPRADRGP